jgi:hypothetical protein
MSGFTDDSRMTEMEEKNKWAMKCFDYAESPVKEWISQLVEETPEALFEDYKNEYGELLTGDTKSYQFYISTAEPDRDATGLISANFAISKAEFEASDALRKAASVMFDAVYLVYNPIVKCMKLKSHTMSDIVPFFRESNMSFRFVSVNALKAEKGKLMNDIVEANNQMQKLDAVQGKEEQVAELKDKLRHLLEGFIAKYNSITDDAVAERQAICDAANAKLEHGPFLYVYCEPVEDDINLSFSRMPVFGNKYSEPNEIDQLTEDLKKI